MIISWKVTPDKCHLLINSCDIIKMKIGDFEIENGACENLLGIHFDYRLTFDYPISKVCKKS